MGLLMASFQNQFALAVLWDTLLAALLMTLLLFTESRTLKCTTAFGLLLMQWKNAHSSRYQQGQFRLLDWRHWWHASMDREAFFEWMWEGQMWAAKILLQSEKEVRYQSSRRVWCFCKIHQRERQASWVDWWLLGLYVVTFEAAARIFANSKWHEGSLPGSRLLFVWWQRMCQHFFGFDSIFQNRKMLCDIFDWLVIHFPFFIVNRSDSLQLQSARFFLVFSHLSCQRGSRETFHGNTNYFAKFAAIFLFFGAFFGVMIVLSFFFVRGFWTSKVDATSLAVSADTSSSNTLCDDVALMWQSVHLPWHR